MTVYCHLGKFPPPELDCSKLGSLLGPASAGIPKATAKRILPALREAGVLKTFVEASWHRSAVLSFPALFNIAESREVF